MSKFDDVYAEAAYRIAGHGFTDAEYGSSTEGPHWNALVAVSTPILYNLGEVELAEEVRVADHDGEEVLVWVREYEQGFVIAQWVARADQVAESQALEQAFNGAAALRSS